VRTSAREAEPLKENKDGWGASTVKKPQAEAQVTNAMQSSEHILQAGVVSRNRTVSSDCVILYRAQQQERGKAKSKEVAP
jgi:hypothetical protein